MISSLLFMNLMFFLLIGIGGAAMASVDGVALPWIYTLIPLWIVANLPYVFYLVHLVKNKENEKGLSAIKHSIASSAWLAFPGGITIFIFFGSKIFWVGFLIPFIQIIIAVYIYIKYR